METTTTTTTKASRDPLVKLAKGSRFEGRAWRADGTALAATDGTALAVRGVLTLSEAVERLRGSSADSGLPAAERVAAIVEDAAKDLFARFTRGDLVEVRVAVDAQPDPRLAALTRGEREARIEAAKAALPEAEQALRRAEERLVEARQRTPRRRGETTTRLDEVSKVKRRVRELREVAAKSAHAPTDAHANGIFVGPAAVDLRIVRRVYAALGVAEATLVPTGGEYDAVAILSTRGVALVMPFRA